MTPSRGFEDAPMKLSGGVLKVKGFSEPLANAELISRYVAVEQDGIAVKGPASLGEGKLWDAGLPADGFHDGPADAVGTETYFFGAVDSKTGEPLFLNFTWSQVVEITSS